MSELTKARIRWVFDVLKWAIEAPYIVWLTILAMTPVQRVAALLYIPAIIAAFLFLVLGKR